MEAARSDEIEDGGKKLEMIGLLVPSVGDILEAGTGPSVAYATGKHTSALRA
jgi:hypothetical protein